MLDTLKEAFGKGRKEKGTARVYLPAHEVREATKGRDGFGNLHYRAAVRVRAGADVAVDPADAEKLFAALTPPKAPPAEPKADAAKPEAKFSKSEK